MSKLDDLKRSYGDTRELPLTDQQHAQKREWSAHGALALEYPELANPSEYQRYLADPAKWLRDRRGELA